MKGLSRATAILSALTAALALSTFIVSVVNVKRAKKIRRII